MTDNVDTSAEAVTTRAKRHWNGGDYETAALLRALLRERDEARAALVPFANLAEPGDAWSSWTMCPTPTGWNGDLNTADIMRARHLLGLSTT